MLSKSQVNLRLPDIVINALKQRAESEGRSITALVTEMLKEDLGLEPETSAHNLALEQHVQQLESRLVRQEALLENLGKMLAGQNTPNDLAGAA
jgi:hypothetical protein